MITDETIAVARVTSEITDEGITLILRVLAASFVLTVAALSWDIWGPGSIDTTRSLHIGVGVFILVLDVVLAAVFLRYRQRQRKQGQR